VAFECLNLYCTFAKLFTIQESLRLDGAGNFVSERLTNSLLTTSECSGNFCRMLLVALMKVDSQAENQEPAAHSVLVTIRTKSVLIEKLLIYALDLFLSASNARA
jgi:hypothetical protein